MEDEKTKVCEGCGRELPLSEFPKHRLAVDGHMSYCHECRKRKKSSKASVSGGNPLDGFTPRELMLELKRRGYDGELTYTEVHRINLRAL